MSKVPLENLSAEALKYETKKPRSSAKAKTPKPKKDRSLRGMFRAKLRELDVERLKKPWMARKSFKLLPTEEALRDYVDGILADRSRWLKPFSDSEAMPIIAVDTETHGLDTRVIVAWEWAKDPMTGGLVPSPIYEVNIEIAGICLSADGIQGVYIPIHHEDGQNVPLEAVHYHLQRLFNVSHLVFYNAKFDREVLRQTCAIEFRDYPYFEDVQVLQFLWDPKADLDDDTFTGGAEGLKGLSWKVLGIQQIDLDEIGKVKAEDEKTPEELEAIRLRPEWQKIVKKDGEVQCSKCGGKAKWFRKQIVKESDGSERLDITAECDRTECCTKVTYKKAGQHVQYVPFTWIPTGIAVWYAAADAICTWLLWKHLREVMREAHRTSGYRIKTVHAIDGTLIDTLTWIERQRFVIDTEKHARLVRWSRRANEERRQKLRELAKKSGWQEQTDDEGNVFQDTVFNVDSPVDLPKLLFDIKGFEPTKYTDSGKRSCDADALLDLLKQHPHDEFLLALQDYKEYVALHPEKLSWDKRDKTARVYLKQATVAGGRLAAAGGKFDRDGGVSMNIQAIKSVGGNWWVKGKVLTPDRVEEADVEEHEECELHPSCFKEAKKDEIVDEHGEHLDPSSERYAEVAQKLGFQLRDGKWMRKAPGIIKNHIANYIGYSICLVPGCKTCAEKHGVLIEDGKLDANQIINLRCLFISEPGWTFCCTDYSNIEMRVAANISGEPAFIREFLEGSGDFHTLTASNVFPEFNDPNTSKARKKELRSLAKIINFALLYGGTEYTIYENMKKQNPDITMKDTKKMVDAYWEKVPKFREWCDRMQRTAREEMTCTTPFGRVIKFQSQMDALGITKPTDEQMDLYFQYLRIRKAHRELETKIKEKTATADDIAQAAVLKNHMDALWNDRDTGVRNAIDYNRFISKIQRVSVNAPLQGHAGEFMRMALNAIRHWATVIEPLVQSVFRLHCSVHDETDYAVKNQYMPFVVPRITRIMKLRKVHKDNEWPVGIECDTEYGHSWDVSFHLTGDDGHKPSGWTDVEGMAEYLPADFDRESVDMLVKAISSGKPTTHEKARAWLEANLHPRAYEAAKYALWEKDKTGHFDLEKPLTNVKDIRKQLFAAMQLHEFWVVDGTPDEETGSMETFEQYEQRCGLTPADRGFMPEGGWLHSVPLNRVRRKPLPILGPEPEPDQLNVEGEPEPDRKQLEAVAANLGIRNIEFDPRMSNDQAAAALQQIVEIETQARQDVLPFEAEDAEDIGEPDEPLNAATIAIGNPLLVPTNEDAVLRDPEEAVVVAKAEDDLFYEAPKKRTPPPMPVEPPPPPESAKPTLPVLRSELDHEELRELSFSLGKGFGQEELTVLYNGGEVTFKKLVSVKIPEKFLETVHA